MQILINLIKSKLGKKKIVKKDYLDKLGREQIKKMVDRGMKMPVVSL